jgi:16S rRNA (cytosine1402-N4)-methyltransferase
MTHGVDAVLLDLGVSSPQLDDATRGFSFQKNGPLDMRMNPLQGESAAGWLAHASEKEISTVLWELGEERFARRIARKIVEARQLQDIDDTKTLSDLISGCVPRPKNKKHPATRSFQAIRIYINQELTYIGRLLDSIFDVLKIGGRLLVISFHSLEDRLVKRFFRLHSSKPKIPRGLPVRDEELMSGIRLRLIGKAIRAGAQELSLNPRARSAVLRVAERTA